MRVISARSVGMLLGITLVCLMAGMPVYATTTADLVIGTVQGLSGGQVSVPVSVIGHGTAPGAVTIKISYDATYLTYVPPVVEGASTTAAGKQVLADLLSDGELSLAVFGLTTNSLPDGVLFTLKFTISQSLPTARTAITGSEGSIASTLGASIPVNTVNGAIELICDNVGTPQAVTASNDRTDGVLVQWSAASAATAYRVYRSTLPNPATAVVIADWATGLEYLDESAVTTSTGTGCNAINGTATTYYYWVQPRKDASCLGEFAGPASGTAGTSKTSAAMPGDILVLLLAAGLLVLRRQRTRPGVS